MLYKSAIFLSDTVILHPPIDICSWRLVHAISWSFCIYKFDSDINFRHDLMAAEIVIGNDDSSMVLQIAYLNSPLLRTALHKLYFYVWFQFC